jgi:hypothetical protein
MLSSLHIKAFTEAPKVLGIGEAGKADDFFAWPGFNSLILAAMKDDHAAFVMRQLKEYRDDLAKRRQVVQIPLRVLFSPANEPYDRCSGTAHFEAD